MQNIVKYPSTSHIQGSSIQKNDSLDTVKWSFLKDKFLVIEEKIDGSSSGISFDSDGELLLQSRGHFLKGHDLKHFDLFKTWASAIENHLFDILTDRYVMYGEWMYALHSVYYDELDHYFYEFDIWDKVDEVFLSTEERHKLLAVCPVKIESVKVLKSGIFNSLDKIISLVDRSNFISDHAYDDLIKKMTEANWPQSDFNLLSRLNKEPLMEGLYIKWEEDGIVKGRYKYVRSDFTQTVSDGDSHWNERKIIPNKILDINSIYS